MSFISPLPSHYVCCFAWIYHSFKRGNAEGSGSVSKTKAGGERTTSPRKASSFLPSRDRENRLLQNRITQVYCCGSVPLVRRFSRFVVPDRNSYLKGLMSMDLFSHEILHHSGYSNHSLPRKWPSLANQTVNHYHRKKNDLHTLSKSKYRPFTKDDIFRWIAQRIDLTLNHVGTIRSRFNEVSSSADIIFSSPYLILSRIKDGHIGGCLMSG